MSDVLLETRNLVIKFGGVTAADNVSLKIHAGKNLAIIGPNGAGKTTFLNICTGWLKPSNGQVLFEGQDITPCRRARSWIAAWRGPFRFRSCSPSTRRWKTC
ncbi:MAG: ATP-binding cassette domain-containing protein [Roseovarius pacificus]|nr:ATP-binding cassette domain-containing protein [Roseovarius pacificus]